MTIGFTEVMHLEDEGQGEGQRQILPDVLAPGLRVVFCGSAVGTASARAGAYYAGPGNRFWETLYRTGLTPRRLAPPEFRSVLAYGIGLTDLSKSVSGADEGLRRAHFDAAGLRRRIERYRPGVLAFNGKRAAREFYGRGVAYGRQTDGIGPTVVFVLPSTSGAARRFWDEACWRELADLVRAQPTGVARPRER
jgi:TDG/mug DNA glycosylase family protein